MKCHICHKKTDTFTDGKTQIVYYACKSCEYIFKSPECYQDFDTQKKRYDLHTNSENDAGYVAYFQRFLDFVLPLVDNPKNALDFGCGESSVLAALLEKAEIPTDYYDPIYYPLSFDDSKKYELILSTEVFEHLHKPKEIFATLVSMLEKGGYLALQTQFCSMDKEKFKKWYYHQDPTHIVFFNVKTFEVLASMHRCKVIATDGVNKVLIVKN